MVHSDVDFDCELNEYIGRLGIAPRNVSQNAAGSGLGGFFGRHSMSLTRPPCRRFLVCGRTSTPGSGRRERQLHSGNIPSPTDRAHDMGDRWGWFVLSW